MRVVLGAMKSNPISDMEKTADIEPLDNRRRTKIIMLSERMWILPSHPLHSRLSGRSRSRLKRKSLNHLVKDLRREHDDILRPYLGACEKLAPDRCQHTELEAEIRTQIPGVLGKDSQIPAVQRALTLEYLNQEYPKDTWILAYTDGSVAVAVHTGGSGSLICHPEHQAATLSLAAGEICTNFRAEVKAISVAAKYLITSNMPPLNAVFLTDSLSTLQALTANNADALIR